MREHGFPLPPAYDDHATPSWEGDGARSPRPPAPTVPCNNDLLAGNFIDDGERVWLIDYEYSGNNDACFELGNTTTECDFDADQVEAPASTAYFGRDDPAPARPGAAAGAVRRTAGRCGGSSRPPRATLDFDFHAWGMERFEKAARGFTVRPASSALLEEVAPVTTDAARPAPASSSSAGE